jgi:hypothetical protein
MILVNQLAEPGLPRPPLPASRWRCSHMTQPLQRRQGPRPTGRQVGMGARCQPPGAADEVGQASLARLPPGLVHTVAVTDQG